MCHTVKPVTDFYIRPERGAAGVRSKCKECTKLVRRQYHYSHLVAERIKSNEWRKTHRNKAKEAMQRFREAHRELCRDRSREWRRRFPEESKNVTKRYLRTHPDKKTQFSETRRARQRSAKGSITATEWQELKQSYRHSCLRCGQQEPVIALTMDHVIPLARGGSHTIDNIQPLCARCNSTKRLESTDFRHH